MNVRVLLTVILLPIACAILTRDASVCRGAERRRMLAVAKEVEQIESLWKAGNPWNDRDHPGYYTKAWRLTNEILEAPANRERTRLAARLLAGLLAKEFKMSERMAADPRLGDYCCDLSAMSLLAGYLTNNVRVPGQDREADALLLARYLGRVRKEKIPNYKPKEQLPPPPPGAPVPEISYEAAAVEGLVEPSQIADPALRTKAIAARRRFMEDEIVRVRQEELQSTDVKEEPGRIVQYLASAFRGKASSPLLARCIEEARLTDEERKQVEAGVREEIDPATVGKELAECERNLEGYWKAGHRDSYQRRLVDSTDRVLSLNTETERNRLATELLRIMGPRRFKTSDIPSIGELIQRGVDDLYAIGGLAKCLLQGRAGSPDECQERARLLCKTLGRVREESVPNFKWKWVAGDPDVPPAYKGLRTEYGGATDPVLRAKHPEALRENAENGCWNVRQAELHAMDRELARPILDNLVDAFTGADKSSALLAECIKDAHLTDDEAKDVLRRIASK